MSAPEQGSKAKPISNSFLPETHFHFLSILGGSSVAPWVQFSWAESFLTGLWYSFGDFCSHTSYSKQALVRGGGEEDEGRRVQILGFFHLLWILLPPFSLPWPEREPSVPLSSQFSPAIGPAFRKQYFLLDIIICSLRSTAEDAQLICDLHSCSS